MDKNQESCIVYEFTKNNSEPSRRSIPVHSSDLGKMLSEMRHTGEGQKLAGALLFMTSFYNSKVAGDWRRSPSFPCRERPHFSLQGISDC